MTAVLSQERVNEVAEKFELLDYNLNLDVVERSREILTSQVAVVAKRHHFQFGPPGIAKSMLVRRFMKYIEGATEEDMFHWLLTKYTTPEEIFGPPSLKALEMDVYRRNLAYKLPVARIAFLDEIFKANSSILNSLLTIFNERLFFNGAAPIEVSLGTVFSASNELPSGEELNALWDRIHFRHQLRPIQDGGNFVQMLQSERPEHPDPILTWADISTAQEMCSMVELPVDVYDAMKVLRDNLRKEGVEPTERRFKESLAIIRGTALLNGRTTADIEDMRLLRHVMWDDPTQQKVVDGCVLSLANPIDKEATDLLEQVEGLGVDLDEAIANSDSSKRLSSQAVDIHGKMSRAREEMEDLLEQAKVNNRKSEMLPILQQRFVSIGKKLMTECFGIESPTGPSLALPDIPDMDDSA